MLKNKRPGFYLENLIVDLPLAEVMKLLKEFPHVELHIGVHYRLFEREGQIRHAFSTFFDPDYDEEEQNAI